jgi:hypothetical protein
MQFTGYSFGSIGVEGVTYDHDLIVDPREGPQAIMICLSPALCKPERFF